MFSFLRFALLLGALPVLCKTEQADKLSLFLQREQQRNFAELKKLDSLQPYFIAYRVHDTEVVEFSANKGGVVRDSRHSSRAFGAEVRVGGSAFDNTHPIRENLDFVQWSGYQNVPWPLEGNEAYWRKSLRIATDYAYRSARDRCLQLARAEGLDAWLDGQQLDAVVCITALSVQPACSRTQRSGVPSGMR